LRLSVKVGDLVKVRDDMSLDPVLGIILGIAPVDMLNPELGIRYVVRWSAFGSVTSYTQRVWHRDIEVVSAG